MIIRDINNQINNELSPAQRRGILNINKIIQMNQRQKLRHLITEYMATFGLNTYNVRILERKKKGFPLGASITTVNKILKEDTFNPSTFTIKKICDTLKISYTLDCGIICINE
jgi:hypothetical protein